MDICFADGCLIAHGVPVYTDKTFSDLLGSRVNFTDGSWCDVFAQIIVNVGPGSLSLEKPAGLEKICQKVA
jgi:hypothetical protein